MRISEPMILYLVTALPFVYALFFRAHRRRLKAVQSLGVASTLNNFSRRQLTGTLKRDGLFACLALFFFILALSKPQAGTRLEPVVITGSDMYIAIDLSQSMLSEDVEPNRLERAKIDALELIKSLQGDRAGLILFAGDAFVQCPLTTDYDALTTVINALDRETAVESGTSIAAPLETALHSLKPEDDKYALILLMTDGENTGGGIEKTLRDVRKRGIKVFSIGIGTTDGAPIPLYDDEGNRTGYKKDRNGKVVISRLNDDMLKGISESTNGHYFKAGKTHNEIEKFLSTLETLKKREIESKKYTVFEERYQIPLGLGILFLLIYIFTVHRVRRSYL